MADTIIRVVYEGATYDLDIENDIPLRLDISAVENQAIGKFFGVGSQQFILPGTRKNNRFFKHAYNNTSVDIPGFYNSITGYIIRRGETLLNGQFQLIEVITDQQGYVTYTCRITDSVVQFNSKLGSKLIKDGDWTSLDHDLTYANITASWEDNGLLNGSVFYPLVEYGFQNPDNIQLPWFSFLPSGSTAGNYLDNSLTPLQAQQFLPAVKVKDTLDVIFDQVDFRYTGSFVAGSDFENLYILPKAQEGLGVVGESGSVGTCFVTDSSNQSISPGSSNVTVELDDVITDPTNAFNTTGHYYQISDFGEYVFSGKISFFNPTSFTGGSVTVRLEMIVGTHPSSGTILSSQERTLTSADGFNTFSLSVGASYNSSGTSQVWIRVDYIVNSGSPNNLGILFPNFQCTQAPAAVVGANVNMGLQFGANTKSIDLLNGLIQQFNLVLTPVKNENNLISIDTFDTWVRNGERKDWTQKFDTAQRIAINHTVDEQPKQLLLKNVDDVDRFSKAAIESDPYYQYGSLRLLADNNISTGERTIGDYFGPVVLGGPFLSTTTGTGTSGDGTLRIDTSNPLMIPHLYKYENSNIVSYAFKPRIGYKVRNSFNGTIYIGPTGGGATGLTGNYATIANVSDLPALDTSKDLLFNNTYSLFTYAGNLSAGISNFDTYWKTYLDSLYWSESTKLTIDLEFSPYEYSQINLNDRIFIKDTWYRINNIRGFNVTEKDVITVELIKLYPAYFEGISNVGCNFTVSGVLNAANCAGFTPTPIPPTPTPVVPTSTPGPGPTSTPIPPTPTPTPTPIQPTATPVPHWKIDSCDPAYPSCYTNIPPDQASQQYVDYSQSPIVFYTWDNTSPVPGDQGNPCLGIQKVSGAAGCITPTPVPPTATPFTQNIEITECGGFTVYYVTVSGTGYLTSGLGLKLTSAGGTLDGTRCWEVTNPNHTGPIDFSATVIQVRPDCFGCQNP